MLSKGDPCPSPERADTSTNGEPQVEVDIAQTMCDVWSRVSEVELKYKKAARRQAVRRNHNVKLSVCQAFGCSEVPIESNLFRAACGFVEGSQEQYIPSAWRG